MSDNDEHIAAILDTSRRGMDLSEASGIRQGRLTMLSEMLAAASGMRHATPCGDRCAACHVSTFLLSFGKAETWRPTP